MVAVKHLNILNWGVLQESLARETDVFEWLTLGPQSGLSGGAGSAAESSGSGGCHRKGLRLTLQQVICRYF